jgi:glycosyltransferase involved in cell wall biosynthesis
LPKLVQDVDLIFSTGYDTANELEKLSGKKVIVQPSGINEIFFQEFEKSFESKSFTVITVANLFPKKNIEFVLKIAQELKECRFVVVGEGTHREVLENIIQENKITNVELVGFKTPEQVREYYQKSDCYLLTSFAEGTPTSALEAMACGLPILSSNAGGLGNIVKEKENGFIIDNFDKNKYIEKINFLKNNRNLIERIFKNNRCLSQNYKWINVAENITRNIEKVLNEKN